MNRVAALLRSIKDNLAMTYVDRTGAKKDTVTAWMADETWFSAEAAVQHGFADLVTAESAVTACFDTNGYRNVPDWVKRRMRDSASGQPALDVRRQRIADMQQRAAA
jgi:hypothetical protein